MSLVSTAAVDNKLIIVSKVYEKRNSAVVVVVLLFYIHGKHLWSRRGGQLT